MPRDSAWHDKATGDHLPNELGAITPGDDVRLWFDGTALGATIEDRDDYDRLHARTWGTKRRLVVLGDQRVFCPSPDGPACLGTLTAVQVKREDAR